MISIHYDTKDLLQVRFAYSPLVELSLSYTVLLNSDNENAMAACGVSMSVYYRRWASDVRRQLGDVRFPFMDAAILPKRYLADFLTPTPHTTRMTFEDELNRLMETPKDIIWKNMQICIALAGESDERLYFLKDPQGALYCLVEELRLYWDLVLARHWSRIMSVLEGDVLYRSRQITAEGVDRAIEQLNPSLELHLNEIRLVKSSVPHDSLYHNISFKGQGFQLVPSIFAPPQGVKWQINEDWHPMIIYSARGTGLWYGGDYPDTDEALEITLGSSKARVLQALATPINTSELAYVLNVTAGSVSQQLGRLTQAGLVESTRSGNRVYYRLSPRGERLLEVFMD